jgi:hypothetical protein
VGKLHVALHDGFYDDSVEILVDGQVVYSQRGVTTLTQISRADEVEVEVEPDAPCTLEVRLPERGIATTVPMPERAESVHVAVSLVDDALVHRFSDEEFRYA